MASSSSNNNNNNVNELFLYFGASVRGVIMFYVPFTNILIWPN